MCKKKVQEPAREMMKEKWERKDLKKKQLRLKYQTNI